MSINETALDGTAFFVIFGAITYLLFRYVACVWQLAKIIAPIRILDHPMIALAVLSVALDDVTKKHRLDEYSLSLGLAIFGFAALLGLNPRPDCAAMILSIMLFNTFRPAPKKALK